MAKIMTKLGELDVPGGKSWEAQGQKGIKDGDIVTTFRNDEYCDFKYAELPKAKDGEAPVKPKHKMHGKTVRMHVVEAAVQQKLGKGEIVKGSEKNYTRK